MKIINIIIFAFLAIQTNGQNVIELHNPSFEDSPACCKAPEGWNICGNKKLRAPDVQPGQYDVQIGAIEGDTYLGLVTRDNDTWQFVSQELSFPIKSGQKYRFSLYLAQSLEYVNLSLENEEYVYFDRPIKLRIWGSKENCSKNELLAESPLIDHEEWLEYEFIFKPRGTYYFITFEAFYKTPTLETYNGNILMDNCSDIEKITLD